MIRGFVNARREAILPLRIVGPNGHVDVAAIVDTGFTGSLTLPAATAAALGLAWSSRGTAKLADGTDEEFDVFALEVEWGGSRRAILASAIGTEVLLGMGMLHGTGLWVEIVAGGAVEVRPLP